MPFTPSHAVVALPFLRTPLVPAAIAVGAMTPDLPLFVRGVGLQYGRTHDLLWLPATMLLALGLLLVWRVVLRPATRELSPLLLATRLPTGWDAGAGDALRETVGVAGDPGRRGVSARASAVLLVSLAVGVMSHIVWDLFTHEGRWGSDLLPVLDQQWGALTGYKWLQHGSSVVGFAVIGVWMLAWVRRQDAAEPPRRVLTPAVRWAWWVSLPVILVVAWVGGVVVLGPLDSEFTVAHLAYRVLPPACAVWGALTLALAVVVQILRARSTARTRRS